jgi:hypothetical protein
MGKLHLMLLLSLMLLVSGCTAEETGRSIEDTGLTAADIPNEPTQEEIEEIHKEFKEFEKSKNETPPEENKTVSVELSEQNESPQELPEETPAEEEEKPQQQDLPECPSSCDDGNPCTKDFCSEETDYFCLHEPIAPCCGNSECEESEDWSACPEDCSEPECELSCGSCEIPDEEACSCNPIAECLPGDGCCPEGCAQPEDTDCTKPALLFSEIFYNAPGNDEDHEWIEVCNTVSSPVDITQWRLEENEQQHLIKSVSEEVLLRPGECAVIAEDAEQFMSDYPGYSGPLFDSSFSLSNTGEELVLRPGKDAEIADSVLYDSTWGGDGNNFSIEKIDINGPNTEENWKESIEKGTPGRR